MREAIYDINRLQIGPDGVEDFLWPVSRGEIIAVRNAFMETAHPYLRQEGRNNHRAQLVGVLTASFLVEMLTCFQAQTLIRRSKALGREPVFSPHAELSCSLLAGRLPTDRPTINILRRGIAPDTLWRKSGRFAKSMLRGNGLRKPPLAMLNVKHDIITVADGEMIRQHAAAVGRANYVPLQEWFAPLSPEDKDKLDESRRTRIIRTMIDAVDLAFKAADEPMNDLTARHLRRWLEETVELAGRYVSRILSMPQRVPLNLWRGTGGLVWSRLLALANRELGGTVTGHDHAHGTAIWKSFGNSAIELPFCDRFMVWTATQQALTRRNLRPEVILPDAPPDISVVPGRFKPKIRRAKTRGYGTKKGRTVMYTGTLYVDDFVHFSPLRPAPVLVDWEARLIAHLKSWGYEVILKPHPESINPAPKALLGLGATLFEDRFEEIYHRADIAMLGQQEGTVFFGVIGTRMPIVLPVPSLEPWQDDMRGLAEKRCYFADTKIGEDGRLTTDWEHLRRGLDTAKELTSTELFEAILSNNEQTGHEFVA